ncbi:uncharacterized protein (DUF2164 family) [Rhizobium sp. AN67]|nr:DUF2164 domain-containing protein [Rhizobium sp. 28DA2]MDH7805193.1 uncharacterized protein (DUF2164 family) [Rhizobium sp. AN67]
MDIVQELLARRSIAVPAGWQTNCMNGSIDSLEASVTVTPIRDVGRKASPGFCSPPKRLNNGGSMLEKQERAVLAARVREYLARETETEIGLLQAEIFVDFLAEEVGYVFYNQGLKDAHAAILRRLEDAAGDIDVLEKPRLR